MPYNAEERIQAYQQMQQELTTLPKQVQIERLERFIEDEETALGELSQSTPLLLAKSRLCSLLNPLPVSRYELYWHLNPESVFDGPIFFTDLEMDVDAIEEDADQENMPLHP